MWSAPTSSRRPCCGPTANRTGKCWASPFDSATGEASGQIARLALAPLGNLTGRLPIGNTGRSDVSAFARLEIPSDLRAVLDSSPG
nr:DUF3703 domain-containing protein [Sphingosinithalassobacter sp. CS137]